ncbi:MAG: hypothetical protein WAN43_04500 [Rhodomicrobium sp.]
MCARRLMLMFGSAIKKREPSAKRNIYKGILGRSFAQSENLVGKNIHELPEPPEKDEQGNTLPHDHEALRTNDIVIRRISDKQISDYPNGVRRISSLAFKTYQGPCEGMSVDLERFIREAGEDPRIYVTTPKWYGSLQLSVGQIRDANLLVGYDPVPKNPYHGQIWNRDGKPTKGQQKQQERALRRISSWFVEISGVEISEP